MLPDSASGLPVMQECRRAVEDQRAEEERSEDESITKALAVFLNKQNVFTSFITDSEAM